MGTRVPARAHLGVTLLVAVLNCCLCLSASTGETGGGVRLCRAVLRVDAVSMEKIT